MQRVAIGVTDRGVREDLYHRLKTLAGRSLIKQSLFPAAAIKGFPIILRYYLDRKRLIEEVLVDYPEYRTSLKRCLKSREITIRVEPYCAPFTSDGNNPLGGYQTASTTILQKLVGVFDAYSPILNAKYWFYWLFGNKS